MTSSPGSSRPHAGGFTILELLTVCALIAIVGGLGAGAFQVARRNYAFIASAGRIQGIIRAARNTALSTGTAAVAVVDPVARTVSAHAFERVGSWGLDDVAGSGPLFGASRVENRGGTVVPGVLGSALDFASGGYADCGSDPRFDLRTGIFIEAWVRHETNPALKPPPSSTKKGTTSKARAREGAEERALAIVEKAGSYSLGMTPSGALEGWIGDYRARTRPGAVVPNRWVRVTLRYDGSSVELSADGVPREVITDATGRGRKGVPLPTAAPVTAAAVTISSRSDPFPGEIDEVKLGGLAEPLVYQYPEEEHVVGWKRVIHFDGRGHLDPAFHQEPVTCIFVELPEAPGQGPRTAVHVDYSMTFGEWLARWQRPTDMSQAVEEAKLEAQLGGVRKIAIVVDRLGVVK
jgi:hypothetical protein